MLLRLRDHPWVFSWASNTEARLRCSTFQVLVAPCRDSLLSGTKKTSDNVSIADGLRAGICIVHAYQPAEMAL